MSTGIGLKPTVQRPEILLYTILKLVPFVRHTEASSTRFARDGRSDRSRLGFWARWKRRGGRPAIGEISAGDDSGAGKSGSGSV
jgi:hypothetical protein